MFSKTNLQETMSLQRYHIYEKVIGKGSYGKIYKAWDFLREEFVAMKKLKFYSGLTDKEEIIAQLIAAREIHFFERVQRVNNPHILRLLAVHNIPNPDDGKIRTSLVSELLDMDLKVYMDRFYMRGLPADRVRKFTGQLLDGLVAMHGIGIMHR
jgi:serine/threonine protein kinase